MKYLLTILAIACLASVIALFSLWPAKQPNDKDTAVTINGHRLAKSVIEQESGGDGYHRGSQAELMESAITRELLLQEAQRQAIDKEPTFRTSLETFYEQSLIKVLLDRQYRKAEATVSEEEIDTFLACYGQRVVFSRLPTKDGSSEPRTAGNGQQTSAIFDDLAEPLQVIISSLKPGESTTKYDTGSDQYIIRLDSMTFAPTGSGTPPDRQAVRRLLVEHKREQQINIWLNDLRKSASITIHSK